LIESHLSLSFAPFSVSCGYLSISFILTRFLFSSLYHFFFSVSSFLFVSLVFLSLCFFLTFSLPSFLLSPPLPSSLRPFSPSPFIFGIFLCCLRLFPDRDCFVGPKKELFPDEYFFSAQKKFFHWNVSFPIIFWISKSLFSSTILSPFVQLYALELFGRRRRGSYGARSFCQHAILSIDKKLFLFEKVKS